MIVISGVDACAGGWLAISRDLVTGELHSSVSSTIDDLAERPKRSVVIAIDIPIGLTDSDPRRCDLQARKLLGHPRAASVFSAPIRPALTAASHAQANEISHSVDGKGVSIQAWGLYPRIIEVDGALRKDPLLQRVLYEVHPEVSFMQWNHGVALVASKKSPQGKARRTRLVENHFGENAFAAVRSAHRRGLVADDDINDSFAALWTAERIHQGAAKTIPDPPDFDALGLQMCMWV